MNSYWYVCIVLLLSPIVLICQQPSGVIEVSGRIIQKGEFEPSINQDIELYIMDYGAVDVDHRGLFQFKAPKGLDLHIEIIPSEFKVMRPLDGLLQGESRSYQIEIIILHATQDSLLKAQISELDDQVKRLQEESQLSENQIEKLDQLILDTVLHYEGIQRRYQRKINTLTSNLESASVQNKQLKDSLVLYRDLVTSMNDSIHSLINQLALALEEKYLRQKNHYDVFSTLLLEYQTKLKDLNDFLPQLENCYKHPGALNQFNALGKSYSKARDDLYKDHQEHLQGIRHYWQDESAFEQADQLCEYVFKDIHEHSVLAGMNKNIMPHLKAYATKGTRKVKAVKNAGNSLKSELDPKIVQFEEKLEDLFALLSKEL